MGDIMRCVECLRSLIESGTVTLDIPRYGHVGTNEMFGAVRPKEAQYVVDGTWYCASHALPVYEALPTHMILEDS